MCRRIQSSSASALAEWRFEGSHCSILLMKQRKSFLSSGESTSEVSRCSRGTTARADGKRSASRSTPVKIMEVVSIPRGGQEVCVHCIVLPSLAKNLSLARPLARSSVGGGPNSAIISARCARLLYRSTSGSWPVKRCPPSKRSQICTRYS